MNEQETTKTMKMDCDNQYVSDFNELAEKREVVLQELKKKYEELVTWDTQERPAWDLKTTKLKHLARIRWGYKMYIERRLQIRDDSDRVAYGHPVFIKKGDWKLHHVWIGKYKYERDFFFNNHTHGGGTEKVYMANDREEGYQFWVCTWLIRDDMIRDLRISHWMVDHDDNLQRNTVYLARLVSFDEIEPYKERKFRLYGVEHHMSQIPDSHKRIAFKMGKHVTRFDDYTTVMSPYSMRTTISRVKRIFELLDYGYNFKTFIDKEVKQEWSYQVWRALWKDLDSTDTIQNITPTMLTDLGLLKDTWNTFPDDAIYNKEAYERTREAYDKWRKKIRDAALDQDVDPEIPDLPAWNCDWNDVE